MTHSFPTRRSSDLRARPQVAAEGDRRQPRPPEARLRRHLVFAPRRLLDAARGGGERRRRRAGPGESALLGSQQLPRLAHRRAGAPRRSEEHTSELQSLMRISYAVFCLKKKKKQTKP